MVLRLPRRQLLSFLVLAVATCSITRVSSFVPPPLSGSCSRCPRGGGMVVRGASGGPAEELAGAFTDLVRAEVGRLELQLEERERLEQRLYALEEELKQGVRKALGEGGGSRRQQQRRRWEQRQQEAEQGAEDAAVERLLQSITASRPEVWRAIPSRWCTTRLCARSIFDLTGLLTQPDVHFHVHRMYRDMGEDPTPEGRARLVRRMVARLVREDVPGQLLRSSAKRLERANLLTGWFPLRLLGSDGRVQGEALSRLRLQLQGEVAEALELLDGVAALKDEEQQMLALEREDGVGVMCLVAAAFPHLYLHTNSSTTTGHALPALLMPPRELHCDFRDRDLRDYGEEVSSRRFEIGIVGRIKDMPSTVRRLGQCLGALRWLLETSLPPEEREKRPKLRGVYCLLRNADERRVLFESEELENDCREEAQEVWGYRFSVMDWSA